VKPVELIIQQICVELTQNPYILRETLVEAQRNQNFGNNYSPIGGTTKISHGNIIQGQLDDIKERLKILVDERQNQSATAK